MTVTIRLSVKINSCSHSVVVSGEPGRVFAEAGDVMRVMFE